MISTYIEQENFKDMTLKTLLLSHRNNSLFLINNDKNNGSVYNYIMIMKIYSL